MKLSVIIVNYNVQYFLEQCLISVEKALHGIDAEVWVVDNASVDGSVEMVREKFPWALLDANVDNTGFSKGNNQAIRKSKGEYTLLLNPDTIVQEDTLRAVVNYMDDNPQTGGLGIHMVDGKGNFLPESKRGLPTPWVAFCKISGLYRLFPRSERFNHYYMGSVPQKQTAEVEILSGAFMLMRKEALDKVGLLDETFFMYGEDIDLSWRLIKGGYTNVYFADSSIIHYKGESTKKGSLNYVFVFYNAMIIFAKKHFSDGNARAFTSVINAAIYARAFLAIVQRMLRLLWLPVLDAAALMGGLWLIMDTYGQWQAKVYDHQLALVAFSTYTAVWMFFNWLAGAYDRSARPLSVAGAWFVGTLLLFTGYSLLPEELRFSRALLLMGSGFALSYLFLSRSLLHAVLPSRFSWPGNVRRKCAVVGGEEEVQRVLDLMDLTSLGGQIPVRVSSGDVLPDGFIGRADQLREIIRVHRLDEVIFCGKDMRSQDIIGAMAGLGDGKVEFRIVPSASEYIIGSNSIHTSGELFTVDVNSINKPVNRRRKRVLDVAASLFALLSFPLTVWFIKRKGAALPNIVAALFGRRTWVGFAANGGEQELPGLRTGILNPTSHLRITLNNPETVAKLNTVYARDYRLLNDVKIILQGLRHWGG